MRLHAVQPDKTQKYISTKKKRKVETLVRDNRTEAVFQEVKPFWTDGSGITIKGTKGIQKTGWATVQFKNIQTQQKEKPLKIQQHQTWRGGSKDLESVARCEERAILKAVQ